MEKALGRSQQPRASSISGSASVHLSEPEEKTLTSRAESVPHPLRGEANEQRGRRPPCSVPTADRPCPRIRVPGSKRKPQFGPSNLLSRSAL